MCLLKMPQRSLNLRILVRDQNRFGFGFGFWFNQNTGVITFVLEENFLLHILSATQTFFAGKLAAKKILFFWLEKILVPKLAVLKVPDPKLFRSRSRTFSGLANPAHNSPQLSTPSTVTNSLS